MIAGRFPLAMLLTFEATTNAEYRAAGLESLDFLIASLLFDSKGHNNSRPMGNKGWYPKGRNTRAIGSAAD